MHSDVIFDLKHFLDKKKKTKNLKTKENMTIILIEDVSIKFIYDYKVLNFNIK